MSVVPPTAARNANVATTLTVVRGLKVLRAFRAESVPLGNADLVRRTALSKATVSRITSTLRILGYLAQVPGSRKFQLGMRALSLGHAYVEASPIMEAARPHLQKLADRLNVSVALAVGNDTDMLYLAYCKSARIATLHFGVGSVLPMASTSIGRAWLWSLPPSERQAHIAAIARHAGKEAAVVQEVLERFLAVLAAGRDPAEHPVDVDEDDEVDRPDDQEEHRRDARADEAADLAKGRDVADEPGRDRQEDRQPHDDRRVTEREEQPDPERLLSLGGCGGSVACSRSLSDG